jgi:hypothetical protein
MNSKMKGLMFGYMALAASAQNSLFMQPGDRMPTRKREATPDWKRKLCKSCEDFKYCAVKPTSKACYSYKKR